METKDCVSIEIYKPAPASYGEAETLRAKLLIDIPVAKRENLRTLPEMIESRVKDTIRITDGEKAADQLQIKDRPTHLSREGNILDGPDPILNHRESI